MELSWKWFCQNRIITWKNSFKCILCTFEFREDYGEYYFDDITEHVRESPFHLEISEKINCDLKDTTGKEADTILLEEIVENCIYFNTHDNELTCYLCQCRLPCFNNIAEHIKGYRHLKNIKSEEESITNFQTYVFTNNLHCKECNIYCKTPMMTLIHIMNHFPKMLEYRTNIDIIKVLHSHIVCSLCNVNVGYNDLRKHLKSTQHVKRKSFLKIKYQLPKEIEMAEIAELERIEDIFFNKFDIHTWYCSKCETYISSSSGLVQHFSEENHKLNSEINIKCSDHLIRESIITYECYLCEESFGSDIFSLFFHYCTSVQHKKSVEYFDKIVTKKYLKMKELNDDIFIECSLCNTKIHNIESIKSHLNGKKHKSCEIVNKQLPISQIKSYETQCHDKRENKEIKVDKVKGEKLKIFELASSKRESEDNCTKITKNNNSKKFNSYPIVDEQIELDVLEILNDIDDLNLNKKLINKFIPAHKRESKINSSNNKKNKVSKFDQNILNSGTQYINFCIKKGKKYIYNISSTKLGHINSNINFIIKVNDKQFCLLCNNQFSSELNVIVEHLFCEEHIENFQKKNSSWIKTEVSSTSSIDNLTHSIPYILKTTNESFFCHACKNDVAEYNFFEHSLAQDHMQKCQDLNKNAIDTVEKIMMLLKDTWYYAQFFDCRVCKLKFQMEIEFVEHMKNKNHCKKVKKCMEKGTILEFFTCFACVTCIYGDSSKYYNHCKDIFHERYLSRGDYNVSKMMPPLIDLLNKIEEKKQKLLFESDLIILQNTEERSLLKAVERVVKCVYPNATAYKFGSRCSHTALSNSDLDIFLDCNDMYYKNFKATSSQKYLSSVKDCFESHRDVWYIEEILHDSRVPIIKLRHYPTDLKCDISFSNGLAHRKSKLVRYYNDAYPICRELILYLKKWMIFSQLSGTEGISTFTVSWLVIFYLQYKGVFPSVYELIKCQTRSIIIDGWECGYQKNICIKSNNSNFVEHLVGLFTFYAKFDYQKNVICPYLGLVIEKERFATGELPSKLTSLLSNRNKEAVSLFRFDSPMCMQDPTDLSQNSTKALRKRQLRCFREYCSSSIERILSGQQNEKL